MYVLTKVDHHSPLIDDVRGMMGIKPNETHKASFGSISDGKRRFPIRALYMGIAASIAILLGVGIFLLHGSSNEPDPGHAYYIAYVDGHRLSDEAARSQIEADKQKAEDFMKEMSELEAREKQMIDKFTDFNTLE